MPYGSFGDVVFEVVEYFSHVEEIDFPYARHQTIQPPSTTQWMGKRELKKISLKLKFHFLTSKPRDAYQRLVEMAEKGEAQKLIIAEDVLGDFTIDRIKIVYEQVNLNGLPIVYEIDLELTEFHKKKLETMKIQTKKKPPAKRQQAKAQDFSKPRAIITKDSQNNTQIQKAR